MGVRPIHDRQFVIGPEPITIDGWQHHKVAGDLILSRSPSLPWDGQTLGIMLGDDPDTAAGRYARVTDGQLELDAAGTLGVLYRHVDGRLWASSSPEILRTLDPELEPPARHMIEWGRRECFEPPLSGLDGVRRLMSTQILNLETGTLERRRILIGRPPASYAAALDELEQILRAAARALRERFGEAAVQLTGGSDSRVVLAACSAERVPLLCVTNEMPPWGHPDSVAEAGLAEWDRNIPPRLARACGYEHRFLTWGNADDELRALVEHHECWHSDGMAALYIACGVYDRIPADAVVLWGHVFEVGRCYYRNHEPPAPPEWDAWDDGEIARGDRLYLEQRLGAWLASIMQASDISGHAHVAFANSRRFVSLLLQLPEELRRDGVHQRDLVRRMAPELAGYPVNRSSSILLRARARLARERDLIAYHGSLSRYAKQRLARARGARTT